MCTNSKQFFFGIHNTSSLKPVVTMYSIKTGIPWLKPNKITLLSCDENTMIPSGISQMDVMDVHVVTIGH